MGGPPNGANASQELGPADDNEGSDAYVLLQATDALDEDTSYEGPVGQFKFLCQAHGSAAIEMRLPGAADGSIFVSAGEPIKAALVPAFVNCLDPPLDSDVDGCTNAQELGPDEGLGGRRDPLNFWDFFDPTRDRSVSGLDFFAVLGRFGSTGTATTPEDALSPPPAPPAYHASHDRQPSNDPAHPWRSREPDGAVSGLDFFAVLAQFGDSCS